MHKVARFCFSREKVVFSCEKVVFRNEKMVFSALKTILLSINMRINIRHEQARLYTHLITTFFPLIM